ncbi:MAG: DUF362 domain-containing protein [Thermodesulfobacteriota bacterium]|nr:DUF362 domain-containing protein [Thermodesulfobacteriota bacterium]
MLNKVELTKKFKKNQLIAIKIHFGEKHNHAFIRPIYVRRLVDRIKEAGGKPFLTDCNTLYVGSRQEAVTHIMTAIENGFVPVVVGVPIVIGDGLRGNSERKIKIDLNIYKEVNIGSEIVQADSLIAFTHFKGHELSGFGGTLKNLGMGCAARSGKLAQHSNLSPKINRKKCKGCSECIDWCPEGAISLWNQKAKIDPEKCIGCGECIQICPYGFVKIQWDENAEMFQKKMVEYAYGALKGKRNKSVFLNFLMNITPYCDCYGYSDTPIVSDIGILSSTDPVAIDQAGVDLINQQPGNINSILKTNLATGSDKFRGIFPEINWEVQLDYGEKIGLGSRDYELVEV